MSNEREPNDYDRQAWAEIARWKEPKNSLTYRATRFVTKPVEKGTELLMENTPLGTAVRGIIELLNDAAAYTVTADVVHARFRDKGYEVREPGDIGMLGLEQVDRVVGFLGTRYKAMAATEGAGTGAAGTFGPWWGAGAIAVDLPVIVGIALRAIAHYGTYYGFSPASQGERLFVLHVLEAASSPEDASKAGAMAELTRVGVALSKGATWEELNRAGTVKLIQGIAERLSIRITKAKLAYVVPLLGAGVGAGFNVHYIGKVTNAAYHSYRERFLMRAFGTGRA
jgi:EcsC family protein